MNNVNVFVVVVSHEILYLMRGVVFEGAFVLLNWRHYIVFCVETIKQFF